MLARLVRAMLHRASGHHCMVIDRMRRCSCGPHAERHEQHRQKHEQPSDYAHRGVLRLISRNQSSGWVTAKTVRSWKNQSWTLKEYVPTYSLPFAEARQLTV